MNETLRLGHIAGIRIGVNWSVLVIFTLILVGLAAGRFPLDYPGLDPVAYAVAGGVAAVVFFLSLLAHEMAHAIVARRNGIAVEGITLWLFGGVAKLLGEADDPAADLRIAGVGPLVSLVLGAGFAVLALAASGLGLEGLPVGVLGWLAVINVVLAVFNLVPAAPLDGGRILRALLWRRRGDRTSAAITAARAGRTFGFVLVGLGLLEIILVPGFAGLWFVLIGWFIVTAAGAEEQYARVQGALAGVRVGDVMTRDPVAVPPTLLVSDLLDDYIWRNRFSAFPVVDPYGHVHGLVTLNRLKEVPPERRGQLTVSDIACPLDEVPQATSEQYLLDLLIEMQGGEDGRALVMDAGRLVGIVSPRDVARMLELAQLRSSVDRSHV
jgi:Zn-dependent protease/predicted transcriptional regulator